MSDKKEKSKARELEKTTIKALGLSGISGGGVPCAVDVKDGKIVRIRPLHYDWKYSREELNPWKFARDGKALGRISNPYPLLSRLPIKSALTRPTGLSIR